MSIISIAGLSKRAILVALWTFSKPAAFFGGGFATPELDMDEVARLENGYVDYLCGRVIKTDFSKQELNPWGYDRDNGEGAMKRVIDEVRRGS